MVFRGVISYRSFFGTAESLVILGVVFFFCSYSASVRAGQVSLAWDASTGADGYQLSYGPSSGNYTGNLAGNVDVGNTTSHTLTGLQDGKYYIAAKAYKYNSSNTRSWSGFSNEVIATISTSSTAPIASFTATPTSAPEFSVVTFKDTSTGNITTWSWNFGDGGTSTVQNPMKSYAAGTYTVSLKVTDPGGSSNTATRTNYITATPAAPPPVPPPLPPPPTGTSAGLVGAYNFEEASGTTVADASSQSNKGTISGAMRITTGRFGKALFFDGVNDWVTVNDAASLDLTTQMTLEAWVYPTVNMTDWATVILKEQPGGGLYELYANGDRSQPLTSVTVGGQYRVLSAGPGTWLLANRWKHLAATYDGTTQRLYIDGVQVAQRRQRGPIQVSNSPLRLGGNSVWGEYFKGRIDEVRIYNRVLNAKGIQSDMNTPIRLGR